MYVGTDFLHFLVELITIADPLSNEFEVDQVYLMNDDHSFSVNYFKLNTALVISAVFIASLPTYSPHVFYFTEAKL